jgi:hypothetical protein
MPLRVIGISGGRVFMTTRHSESRPWDAWTDLTSVVGAITGVERVACAIVDGFLHICVSATSGLWHTIQTGPMSFTGWGAAHSVAFPGVRRGSRVACAAMGAQLHVCIDGQEAGHQAPTAPTLWRAIRAPSGAWSPRRSVTSPFLSAHDVACTTVTPPATGRQVLEVFARVEVVGGGDPVVRTTLAPTGTTTEAALTASFPDAGASSNLPRISSVATAGIGSDLHVLLGRDDAELFHVVISGEAFELFGSVRALVHDGAFGTAQLGRPACANVGGNLHVCALSGGRIMHTIELANGAWNNPESSGVGMWGDVTAAVAGNPGTPFVDIACAGDPL